MIKRRSWVWCCAFALVAIVALGAKAETKTFRWSNDGDPTTIGSTRPQRRLRYVF